MYICDANKENILIHISLDMNYGNYCYVHVCVHNVMIRGPIRGRIANVG